MNAVGLQERSELGSVLRGAAQVLSIRLAGAGLAYASMVLLARWLGSFDFGIYAYVWVLILTLAMALPLGFNSSALRFLPDYLGRGKVRRLAGFLRQSFAVAAVMGLAGGVLGCAAILLAPQFVPGHYRMPLLIGFAVLPLAALLTQLEATARAFGWMQLAYIPGYILRPLVLIGVVGGLAAAGYHPDATDALLAISGACLAAVLMQAQPLLHRLASVKLGRTRIYHSRHWVTISLSFLLIEGFRMIMETADVLMLGRLTDPQNVGIYFAAVRTASLIGFIYFAVSAMAVPRFSKIKACGTREELQGFVSGSIQLMFWPSVLGAVALAAIGPFALSLFGADFTVGYPVLLVSLAGLVMRAATGPLEYLLTMTGRHRATMRVYAVGAAVNVTLTLMLVPRLGIVGAAVSTYTAFAVANLWLYVLARRRIGVSAFVIPVRLAALRRVSEVLADA
jgi:O-antigen/teichoic acid export membrane protein